MEENTQQTPEEEEFGSGVEPQTPEEPVEGTQPEGQTGQTPDEEVGTPSEPGTEEDYKKKFSESTREAQRLLEKLKEEQRRREELESKLAQRAGETISESVLAKKYPDWDLLDPVEKDRLIKEEEREMRLARLEEEIAWQKDYMAVSRKFPQLSKVEDEFKEFVYRPENKGASLVTLAKSFLFDRKELVEPKPSPQPKRKGLEKATGGTRVVSTEMSREDIERLRKTDYKRYVKLLKQGRIKKIPEK